MTVPLASRDGTCPRPGLWSRRTSICCLAIAIVATAGVHAAGAQAGSRPADSTRRVTDALTGVVVDVIGQPMDQVEVYIAGTGRTTRTDTRGRWFFADPPPGPRVVVARRTGYVPFVREVVVGSGGNDTLSLVMRRFPTKLSPVEVRARAAAAASDADILAERLNQIRVGSGRLFTRDEILRMRPYSVAELVFGIPGTTVSRTPDSIVVTSTRSGVGIMNIQGQQCQLQFFLDNTPIANSALPALDPMSFRSVEVYPQTVILTGLAIRPDRCGAIVINTVRR